MAEEKLVDGMKKLSLLDGGKVSQIAKDLRAAMKGFGTDEDALIRLLAPLNTDQIQQVVAAYSSEIGRDLIQDIKSETGGKLEDVLVAILTPRHLYDAMLVNKAIKGLGTDEDMLIEILCLRDDADMRALSVAYLSKYDKIMAQEVCDDLSGDMKDLFSKLLNLDRSSCPPDSQIDDDVEKLYKAGEGRIGTKDSVFYNIIGGYPRSYVHKVAQAYAKKHHKPLTKAIKNEFGGKVEDALVALAMLPHEAVSEHLRQSMKGVGTDEQKLLRLVVCHKDTQLEQAAEHFIKENEKSLEKWIESEVGGDFKALLVAIVKSRTGSA